MAVGVDAIYKKQYFAKRFGKYWYFFVSLQA